MVKFISDLVPSATETDCPGACQKRRVLSRGPMIHGWLIVTIDDHHISFILLVGYYPCSCQAVNHLKVGDVLIIGHAFWERVRVAALVINCLCTLDACIHPHLSFPYFWGYNDLPIVTCQGPPEPVVPAACL